MAFENHLLPVGKVAGFFGGGRWWGCWRRGGLDGRKEGDLAWGVRGYMSGGGGTEVATPAVAVEGVYCVVEFVGAVFGVGSFIAATLVLCGGTTEVVGAGTAVVGGCFVVGAGGELIGRAVAGGGADAVDASSFGRARSKRVGIIHVEDEGIGCNINELHFVVKVDTLMSSFRND